MGDNVQGKKRKEANQYTRVFSWICVDVGEVGKKLFTGLLYFAMIKAIKSIEKSIDGWIDRWHFL